MTALPTYEIHVKPKYYSPNDGPTYKYRAVWVKHTSPSTTTTPGGGQRYLIAPWSPYPGIKSFTWWVAWEEWIDTSWDPGKQGQWGSRVNFKTSPDDEEGIWWTWGGGDANVKSDYIGGHTNASGNSFSPVRLVTNQTKGVWHSYLMEFTMGRVSGVSSYRGVAVPQGRIRVWVDGNDTPVDSGPINTMVYAQNPSTGHWILSGIQSLWEGFYTKLCTQDCGMKIVGCRVGRTLDECLADTPTLAGTDISNILDPADPSPDLGPSTLTVITSRTTSDFLLPPSLGGGSPTLPLRLLRETDSRYILGWTPVAGAAGYRFQREKTAPRWSHTWDATLAEAPFPKDSGWYRVQPLSTIGDPWEWRP